MFAGPNGSGKSTVKNNLGKSQEWFGVYINPDEIEKTILETGRLLLEPFQTRTKTDEVQQYFAGSTLIQKANLAEDIQNIKCEHGAIDFSGISFTSYHASVLSDFLRRKLVESSQSFTFETVMSSKDKVDFLQFARTHGFRTYLYYVATVDSEINIQRVANRVIDGGHDVPKQKITDRYERSLKLLPDAVKQSNRAYFFDSSSTNSVWFAEITDGIHLEIKQNVLVPIWFNGVVESLNGA
ncbi:MAG: zeta toxin family protein [Zavarzinella sp.]